MPYYIKHKTLHRLEIFNNIILKNIKRGSYSSINLNK